MPIHAMLTVDLNKNVSGEAWKKVAEHLAKNKWMKLSLKTTWTADFSAGIAAQRAIELTKIDVEAAAVHAGIKNYEVAVIVSDIPPAK